MLGAQAQQEAPALQALSLRTAGRPTAEAIRRRCLDEGRDLVRTWGQRDTLHIYDAATHWARVVAARPQWGRSGRRGGMPAEALVDAAARRFDVAGHPLLRTDLYDLIPPGYAEELVDHPGAGGQPRRLAATRLIWRLAQRGHVSLAQKVGSQQAYAARGSWFPDLEWMEDDPVEAASVLMHGYLSAYAPATAADAAHFFGASVSSARRWLDRISGDTTPVHCGDRRGLMALRRDVDDLLGPLPETSQWPVRLLPLWDTMLMTHKDKSWVIRDDEQKAVWRKAAYVCACVVARGRIVATWSHSLSEKRVEVCVQPLSEWRARFRPAVEAEAAALAAYHGCERAQVKLED